MASINDQVKGNHFDKFCKKVILVNRGGNAYNVSNLGMPGNVFSTTITFVGSGGNGDVSSATLANLTIAQVTGVVAVRAMGYCSSTLYPGTAGIKVGIDSDDDAFLVVASAEDIETGEFWYTGGQGVVATAGDLGFSKIVAEDIVCENVDADIEAGIIKFYIFWEPISADGNVER